MLVNYTQSEGLKLKALKFKYDNLIAEAEAEEKRLRPANCPNTEKFFDGINADDNPQEWKRAIEKENEALDQWEQTGSQAWHEAKERIANLHSEAGTAYIEFYKECERRQFSELKGNYFAIINEFQRQVQALIQSLYETEKTEYETLAKAGGGTRLSYYAVSIGDGKWKLYLPNVRKQLKYELKLFYNAVKDNQQAIEGFDQFIDDTLAQSELVDHTGKSNDEPIEIIKPRNRTKTNAGKILETLPTMIATTTFPGYQNATSLFQEGNAYLQPLSSTDNLKFDKGRIFFASESIRPLTEVELQNIKTKEGIESIDLPLLRTFYSIILTAFEKGGSKEVKPEITLYMPDLTKYLGLQENINKKNIDSIIAKVQSFHNIVGVLHFTRNGNPARSYYAVLNFQKYDEKNNTITFSSPYMNMVIQEVYNIAIKKDKKGAPRLKQNGEPFRLPSHSYLVKSEIATERNKAAVENVFIICTLIEQAGNNIPRIKASTIIERNPQLQQRLENSAKPAQLLKRVFEKTWELLRSSTRLSETYKNIQLPDPKNIANIPTMKTLNEKVFSFPHEGKIKG